MNLVTYGSVHRRAYYVADLLVGDDGTVEQLGEQRVLKELGEGIVF